MPEGTEERAPVKCTDCETVLAAKVGSDGSIRPIGTEGGCPCGSNTFRVLDD